jgi:hypothetical protein
MKLNNSDNIIYQFHIWVAQMGCYERKLDSCYERKCDAMKENLTVAVAILLRASLFIRLEV